MRRLVPIAALLGLATVAAGGALAADECKSSISVKGTPHKIRAVAELNALRAWVVFSQKHGDNYGMWHNALAANLTCETLPDGYLRCSAEGRPCPAHDPQPDDARRSD